MNHDASAPRRPIRSFVLRGGRLTPGQKKAFTQYWSQFGINLQNNSLLDYRQLFGNAQPVWLEIGFGNGESLVRMAAEHPQRNYLGIEVHPPGVGRCLMQAAQNELKNLRIINEDAMKVLQAHIPAHSLHGLQLFFPDPWHKKKHQKRRIVQPRFVELTATILQPGGIFHAATDWEDYARHMLLTFSRFPDLFENQSPQGNWIPRPAERPLTKFEQRGQRLGHGVWDLQFKRL